MEYRSARDLAAALRKGEMSAIELMTRTLADIEARDGAINAVVVRDFERAMAAAHAADAALAQGDTRPLLGLPITVKEAFHVAGLPASWGLPDADAPSRHDAAVVARLKAAGAIVIGKTNVSTMLSDWQSANPVYGVTRNPWALDCTPGGSSGGGAAALAAGFISLEYGSDLASSLRAPAHFCGVCSHKPTYGLVPVRGFAPPMAPPDGPAIDLSVLGPMAREAGDLMLALDLTAGPEGDEAEAWRLDLPPPRHARLEDHRVLILDQHPLLPTAASIRGALADLAARLESAGCRVERSDPRLPDLEEIAEINLELLMAIFSAAAPDDVPASVTHREWMRAHRRRVALGRQWRTLFEALDVVLCPPMPTTAFQHREPGGALRVDEAEIPYERQGLWGTLATLTGQPATTAPIGQDEAGLPIGVQIIGPRYGDRTTIRFAELLAQAFGGFVAPPQSSMGMP